MNEFLRKTVKVYVYLGSWPLLNGSSPFFENLRFGFGLFLVISITVFNVAQYVDIFMQLEHWETLSETVSISLVFSISLIKVYVFYSRRKEIILLANEMDSYINDNLNNQKPVILLNYYQRRVQNIGKVLWIASFLDYVIFYTWPIATILFAADYSLRPLTVRVYFPFSLNAPGIYIPVYLYEVICAFITTLHTLAFDIFFIGCISFATSQLKILQHSIESISVNVQQKLNKNHEDKSISAEDFREQFQVNSGLELKKFVEDHQTIITFCEKIDSMLSPVLLIVFLSYTLIIGFLGFNAIQLQSISKLLQSGQYLTGLLVQLLNFFWHGNELMTESLRVAESALSSDYYNLGARNTKTLLFIIFRSQKPIMLTVGKFYIVTLQNLLSLLSSSYSYFALLKQFYD